MNLVPAEKLNGSGAGRIAGFRPEHVELGQHGGDAVQLTGRVEVREYLGDEQLVHLAVKDTPILAKLPVEEKVTPGQDVTFSIARAKIHMFDAETGERV
jgi:ABC-type sugar transport system ATPase subunit